MLDWNDFFSDSAALIEASDIREISKLGMQPGVIAFGGGAPDPSMFPRDEAHAFARELLAEPQSGEQALQYGMSEGYLPLREWVGGYVFNSDKSLPADNVLITSGAQQSIDFVARLLLNPGDRILTVLPTFPGLLQSFKPYHPEYVDVAGKGGEVDLERFEAECRKGAKLAYLMPDYCNPSSLSMTVETRRAVMQIARKHGVLVVEDHPYDELNYSGERLEPLLAHDTLDSYDTDGSVIHLGTFSKFVAPGLRVGWLMGPQTFIKKAVLLKQAADIHTGSLNQRLIHSLVSGSDRSYVARLREGYRQKRDVMLAALKQHMPFLHRHAFALVKPQENLQLSRVKRISAFFDNHDGSRMTFLIRRVRISDHFFQSRSVRGRLNLRQLKTRLVRMLEPMVKYAS